MCICICRQHALLSNQIHLYAKCSLWRRGVRVYICAATAAPLDLHSIYFFRALMNGPRANPFFPGYRTRRPLCLCSVCKCMYTCVCVCVGISIYFITAATPLDRFAERLNWRLFRLFIDLEGFGCFFFLYTSFFLSFFLCSVCMG